MHGCNHNVIYVVIAVKCSHLRSIKAICIQFLQPHSSSGIPYCSTIYSQYIIYMYIQLILQIHLYVGYSGLLKFAFSNKVSSYLKLDIIVVFFQLVLFPKVLTLYFIWDLLSWQSQSSLNYHCPLSLPSYILHNWTSVPWIILREKYVLLYCVL